MTMANVSGRMGEPDSEDSSDRSTGSSGNGNAFTLSKIPETN